MPKRHASWIVGFSLLSALLLAGCVFSLAPVQALPRVAYADVSEVSVAVGANGFKHYAWTECFGEDETYTCVLVYTRTATGGVLYSHGYVIPIGTFVLYPDVAVSSTGDAYVVYSLCTDFNACVDYWNLYPAADPESVEIVAHLLHTVAVNSEARPQIEARGDAVYAAYALDVGGFVRLRYRQLSGGSRTGYIDSSTLNPTNVTLGIDSTGDLHAVWVRDPVTDTAITYSNNTGAVGNFHGADMFEAAADRVFSRPDLALDDDDRVYLAYSINTDAGDTIRVRCLDVALDCYRDVTTLTVPTVDGPWNIYRNPHLELIGAQPNLVFAASHDSLTNSEIWWYDPPDTGANPDPDQVTNTPAESEGEPLIVEENSDYGDVPIVGWRMFETLLLDVQAPSGHSGYCAGSVFATMPLGGVLEVFEDRGTCANSGFDLAANGEWLAGVWVDAESATVDTLAAWTAFNAHVTYVPVTSR